jgi:hypothetical protein
MEVNLRMIVFRDERHGFKVNRLNEGRPGTPTE